MRAGDKEPYTLRRSAGRAERVAPWLGDLMNSSLLSKLFVPVLLLCTAVAMVLSVDGCDERQRDHTRVFEEAEALYRAGDYDGATRRYETFLEAYPRSPFAKTARMRIASAEREMESVVGTGGANRPVFLRPTTADSEAIINAAVGDAGSAVGPDAGPN